MMAAFEVTGIEYAHTGTTVLRVDEYQFNAGCITAVVGPNGSGKSTLLDILALINPPTCGRVGFFGTEVHDGNRDKLRRQIGYVQQKPYLLNTTVYNNIELGLRLRKIERITSRQKTDAIIDQFGLGNLAYRRAHGLSGGEAQKVAIGRAMILQPEVLLLDEPFSHLDQGFKEKFEALLRAIRKQARQTIIFSTHDQILAQTIADHVCALIDGHYVATATINLFTGSIDNSRHLFKTERLEIHIPESISSGSRLCIEPAHLVLSKAELNSSMRNCFPGVVKSIKFEAGRINIQVDAGEDFLAIITKDALNELGVTVGDPVWISFKSTAVRVY